MKKVKLALMFVLFVVASCTQRNSCNPIFFENYSCPNKINMINRIIYIYPNHVRDSLFSDSLLCAYKCDLTLFDKRVLTENGKEIPVFKKTGNLICLENKVFLKSSGAKGFGLWFLFDFNMQKGDSLLIAHPNIYKSIFLYKNENELSSYYLHCDSILYDSIFKENIYAFRFHNFAVPGVFGNVIDWVFFIGKHSGMVGSYIGHQDNEGTEYYYEKIGQIYDKERTLKIYKGGFE